MFDPWYKFTNAESGMKGDVWVRINTIIGVGMSTNGDTQLLVQYNGSIKVKEPMFHVLALIKEYEAEKKDE